MSPEITISPSEGEKFKTKKVHISKEAATVASVATVMSQYDPLILKRVVPEDVAEELRKLGKALSDSALGK